MKLSSFRYLVKQGFDNVWKNRVMAFASFCVLLVSLLLVGLSVLFYININAIIGEIEQKNEVIIYLNDDVPQSCVDEIDSQLRALPNVNYVEFYSREQAFEDLKKKMADAEELFDSLEDDNPLPDAFRIRVTDISHMKDTVTSASAIPNVDRISSPDTFVKFLTQTRRLVTLVATAIIIAMLVVSMVIISNTTRASVFARRREISIMQSVGATKNFIRFPFFIEGMVNGFLAGAVATLVTWLIYSNLIKTLNNFDMLRTFGLGSILPYEKIAIPVTLAYVLGGALIGAIGSVLSTRVHLKYRAANL
ncbi:MAG: permease-like cell division protein FtsX [Oscillospiraceae bacterium]|nr:permease-like cell division protein FtsX [Oscillospiraceae bacterium]